MVGGITLLEPPAINVRKYTAFTMVELLVVIAIITVLIAILLPTLKKARDAANLIGCASNLHQLGIATIMYLNDNQGMFPRIGYDYEMTNQPNVAIAQYRDNFSTRDMWALVTSYLALQQGTYTVISPGASSEQDSWSKLEGSALAGSVMSCPASVTNQPYNNCIWYCFYPGSANDVPTRIGKLMTVARTHQSWCSQNPAMWADRIIFNASAAWPLSSTNHWNSAANAPSGGNVCCVDGSVQWFPFQRPYIAQSYFDVYMPEDEPPGNNSLAFPCNAIFQVTDGSGNCTASGTYVEIGSFYVSNSATSVNPLR